MQKKGLFLAAMPLIAIIVFLIAIIATLIFFKTDEISRHRQMVQSSAHYVQERISLELLERQNQISQLTNNALKNGHPNTTLFTKNAEYVIANNSDVLSITWVNAKGKVITSIGANGLAKTSFTPISTTNTLTSTLKNGLRMVRSSSQSIFIQPTLRLKTKTEPLQLFVPVFNQQQFSGAVIAQLSLPILYNLAWPTHFSSVINISLTDIYGAVLVGNTSESPPSLFDRLMGVKDASYETSLPIEPVGIGLMLSAKLSENAPTGIDKRLLAIILSLGVIVLWIFVANWRYTKLLLKTQAALSQETSFNKAMEQSMLTGLRVIDYKGKITFVNSAFCHITGWSEADLIGRIPPYPFWPSNPLELQEQYTQFTDELSGKTPEAGIESCLRHKNGSLIAIQRFVSPLIDNTNQQKGWIVSIIDITRKKKMEEQAKIQTIQAQNSSRLITMGEMASSIAHELNQPLAAISNYCSGIISRIHRQQIQTEEIVNTLEKTVTQAQRAGQVIQRIRGFVKRSEPKRVESFIPQIVSNTLELATIEFKRHGVHLIYSSTDQLPTIWSDPILIEQVLLNLFRNAAESIATISLPEEERSIQLKISSKNFGDRMGVEFIVEDCGAGINEKMKNQLFEPFQTTKANGLGIGLNICRSIIESHKGRMWAENIYNAQNTIIGCQFSFWLPIHDIAP